MSVSARTFQLLYIVRQRALEDKGTRLEDFSEFIAERRKAIPDLYTNAYISPSALLDLLDRMSTTERLLVHEATGEYTFTPAGSQMADLLSEIDACSYHFIDNYKEKVVLAALKQRHRLGQGAATQREVASVTNISLDSARRGLAALIDQDLVQEEKDGRSAVYSLKNPPASTTATVVIDLSEDDTPDPEPKDPELAAALAQTDDGTPPRPVGDTYVRDALAGFDDSDEVLPVRGPEPDPEDMPLSVGNILGDEQPDIDEAFKEPTDCGREKDDWHDVPKDIRQGHKVLAEAAGVSLTDYLRILLEKHKDRVKTALFEGYDEDEDF